MDGTGDLGPQGDSKSCWKLDFMYLKMGSLWLSQCTVFRMGSGDVMLYGHQSVG